MTMERISFGAWVLSCDTAATRKAYAAQPTGGSEQCGCLYCRNFAATRQRVFSPDVVGLLMSMGVDVTREDESYELGPADPGTPIPPGLVQYGGWFFAVGQIVVDGGPPVEYEDGFSIFAASGHGPQPPDAFKGYGLVRLEFHARVPWVMKEPYPG